MRWIALAFAALSFGVAYAEPTVVVQFRPAAERAGEGLTSMPGPAGEAYFVSDEVVIGNADIAQAVVVGDAVNGMPSVAVLLTQDAGKRLAAYTTAHVGELMAVLVDGAIVTVPRIQEPILGGQLNISGLGSREDAERVARGIAQK